MKEETFEERILREWEEYRTEQEERLSHFFKRILIVFAILGFTVAGSVYYVYATSNTNKNALCAMRYDAERRVSLSEDFLKENPNGIPGISIDSLRRSTNNAKQTAESLSFIDCPPLEDLPEVSPSTLPEESPVP
jgi:hypothetical protein